MEDLSEKMFFSTKITMSHKKVSNIIAFDIYSSVRTLSRYMRTKLA